MTSVSVGIINHQPINISTIYEMKECAATKPIINQTTIECYTSHIPSPPVPQPPSYQQQITTNTTTNTTTTTTSRNSRWKSWCSNVYLGTHHKTGTVLASRIGRNWCGGREDYKDGTSNWMFDAGITPSKYIDGKRIVHFIRDPLETIVSGYQYHLTSSEIWLQTSGHQARLLNATLEDGLELDYIRSQGNIQNMIDFHKYMREANEEQNVFTVQLDLIQQDEYHFRIFEASIKKWFGGGDGGSSWKSLQRCCFIDQSTRKEGAKHVSKTDEKPQLRQIIMSKHSEEIVEARKILGFPLVGLEGNGNNNHNDDDDDSIQREVDVTTESFNNSTPDGTLEGKDDGITEEHVAGEAFHNSSDAMTNVVAEIFEGKDDGATTEHVAATTNKTEIMTTTTTKTKIASSSSDIMLSAINKNQFFLNMITLVVVVFFMSLRKIGRSKKRKPPPMKDF